MEHLLTELLAGAVNNLGWKTNAQKLLLTESLAGQQPRWAHSTFLQFTLSSVTQRANSCIPVQIYTGNKISAN